MLSKSIFWAAPLLVLLISAPALAQRPSKIVAESTAARHGLTRKWVSQMQLDQTRDQLQSLLVSGDTLFAQSANGQIQAFDSETGATRWSQQVGNRFYPTSPLGVNDQFVAVVNGSTLYLLDRQTGRLVWEKRVPRPVETSPGITPQRIYVAAITGELTSFKLDDTERNPRNFGGTGGVFVPPTVTPKTLAWVTADGRVYAVDHDTSHVRFEFRTDAAIASPLAYAGETFFVASRDGYLYAINEQSGTLRWSFSVADPIKGEPAPIDQGVYITAQRGGMYRLDLQTGAETWFAPEIEQFIAASQDRIYGTGRGGDIVIMDAASGARIDRLPVAGLPIRPLNSHTDRIYLADPNGMILCLHEPGNAEPLVHAPVVPSQPLQPEKPADESPETPAEPTPPPVDPLDEPEVIEDPFADPFG